MAFRPSGLWRHPDFLKLWMGQTISQFGSRISRGAIPLTAVILLTANPSRLGLLTAIASLPPILLGLIAGVWVDRLPRRPILIITDAGRFVILLTIPIAALSGHLSIELLYGIVILTGILTLFFDAAYVAAIPSLVSRENLAEANSKLATTDALAEIGGPAMTGVLIQLISAPLAIFFDAISFLVSAVSLALIRTPEPPPCPREEGASFRAELVEGWRVIVHHPALRALAVANSLRTFFGNFYAVLYSLYVIRDLGFSPAALGIFVSAGGIGALVGAALAGWLPLRFGLGRTLVWVSLIGSFFSLLTPLAGGAWIVAAGMMIAAQLIGDGLGSVYMINELTLRQLIVPDQLLGRANATVNFLAQVIAPVGALIAGLLADRVGTRGTLLIAVLGWIGTALWMMRSPVRVLGSTARAEEVQTFSSTSK